MRAASLALLNWLSPLKPSRFVMVEWPTHEPLPLHFESQHKVLEWLHALRRQTEQEMAER